MAPSWQDQVQAAVSAVLAAHAASGAVIAVARGDQPPDILVIGADAAGRPLAADSLFPLASVTKLATALVILRLADAGQLAVDADLARYVPEAAAARPGVTLRHLLAHTAGLPYDLPPGTVPYAPGIGWPQLAEAALRTPLTAAPGERVAYSNLGYSVLAVVIERVTSLTWPAALTALVLEPLGIEAYLGVEPPRPPARLSDIRDATAGTPLETMNSPYWRSRGLPSSGLVTTAAGALALVRVFCGQPAGFLRPATLAAAVQDQTGGLGGGVVGWLEWPECSWGLGPMLHGTKQGDGLPDEASPESFGMDGLSGCLAWVEPVADLAWSIHTTRAGYSGWTYQAFPVIVSAIYAACP